MENQTFYPDIKHPIYNKLRGKYPEVVKTSEAEKIITRIRKELKGKDFRGNILKYFTFVELCECYGLEKAIMHVGFVSSLYQPEQYPLFSSYLATIS